ncbi:uncharacterized protein LOC129749420 [Uranotaenia lowii]|uniref:uncharacterized protein LOC129749420 n=1 Tax=Uranotaenia lowii TaxID=190385 RepID=UPI002478C03D|nr:uncharacterized protein LOC129749420 [Uranotaenia lowii]
MIAPVDYCANALLLAARDIHHNFTPNKDTIPVYNYASDNTPTYGQMLDNYLEALGPFQKFLYHHLMGLRTANPDNYWRGYQVMRWQASALDQLRILRGHKPVLQKLVDNVYTAITNYKYIPLKDWQLETANVNRLQQGLSQEEADIFYSDLRSIDWDSYQRKFLPAFKKYALQEKFEGL